VPVSDSEEIDLEALLRHGIEMLKVFGGTSLMSAKAHRCLQQYIDALTAPGM
jgi:hypothetical protein